MTQKKKSLPKDHPVGAEAPSNDAPRMSDIAPFHVMELLAHAKSLEAQGRNIVHLEVGEPDFPTAPQIIAAAQEFLAGGHVHYTAAVGLPELRQAIARWYMTKFNVDLTPERIIVTAGASAALQLALAAVVGPGDEWLVPDPGYPCNRNFVRLFEGAALHVNVDASCNYQPTADQIVMAWMERTRGVMLASPSNPTGTVLDPSELQRIADFTKAKGGTLIVDEIYQGLVYDQTPTTALAISDDIFVINSFSKYFGMTGWRLGWLVVPETYRRNVEILAQNMYICASTVAQHAALSAFSVESIAVFEQRRRIFQQRRDILLAGLVEIGFGIPVIPDGAFYVYADSSRFSSDSYELSYRLLNDAGVAATPGVDFGEWRSRAHMRFACTTDVAQITEALARMKLYLLS
jgi:aspartate/methionine/tyrosine aminotransferase